MGELKKLESWISVNLLLQFNNGTNPAVVKSKIKLHEIVLYHTHPAEGWEDRCVIFTKGGGSFIIYESFEQLDKLMTENGIC